MVAKCTFQEGPVSKTRAVPLGRYIRWWGSERSVKVGDGQYIIVQGWHESWKSSIAN
ncbi:unnamed protein product [Penicillium camemberti]|uniref:Str. FM013 n=1 Tax=Penicillium camemberti (strain FM 013) TaxID=1429867 RepID=A0A0G4NWS2_PENC3|nr:unnamed protein product [Penicillium camemberti]